MSLDRLLEEATSPADAAEAAQLMAAATAAPPRSQRPPSEQFMKY